MDLPEGKRAGFYAQVVKGLAEAVALFDRDKELIVLDDEPGREKAAGVLEKYKIDWEPVDLILLPEGVKLGEDAAEIGFDGRFGNAFLYAERAERFRIEAQAGAEAGPALQQLEEHIALSYDDSHEERKIFVCEPHLRETVAGIARRYGVRVEFL